MNILFLDIDGVLNDSYTWQNKIRTPNGYTGIDDKYVELLSKVVKKYGFNLVLSSDWRYDADECDYAYMVDKLRNFGLEIMSQTPRISAHLRAREIKEWLNVHKDVEKYIILDDNYFDFEDVDETKYNMIITNGLTSPYPLFDYGDSEWVDEICRFIKKEVNNEKS